MTLPAWALLKRELTATLRGKGAFAMLAAVGGVCIIIVILNWPRGGATFSYVGSQARTIFCLFFFTHLLAATLLPPALAAMAFSEEHRMDTLDQLRLSLVSRGGLVGAKLLSAVAVFVLLFTATLPCLGAQLMLVGVSTGELLGLIAVTLSTVCMGAAMGILCAMAFRRPIKALAMSYVGTAFALGGWVGFVMMPVYLISLVFFDGNVTRCLGELPGGLAFERLTSFATHAAFDSYLHTLSLGVVSYSSPWPGVTYRLLIAAACVLSAALLQRRLAAPATLPSRRLIDEPEALRARQRRFPFYLVDPLRRKPPIADGDNPILIRECRYSLGRRPRPTFWAFTLTAGVVAILNVGMAWANPQNQWVYEDGLRVMLVLQVVAMILIVQIVAAGAFAREREQMGMDFLRTSLLSPASIFWGQFVGGAAAAFPFLAGATAGFLVSLAYVPFGLGKAPMLLGGYATLLTCVWLTLCISYLVSGFVKNTGSAIGTAFVVNLFAYLWPVFGIVWCEDNLRSPLVSELENLFERLSPVVALCVFRSRYQMGSSYGQIQSHSIEGDLYLLLLLFAAVGFLLMVVGKSRLERRLRGDW